MNNYNYNLDTAKFFCVIAVVLIHTTAIISTTDLANIANYYSYRHFFDIAVPFFFATSGYLISSKKTSYVRTYTKKIFTMYIVFSLFYFGLNMVLIFLDRIILGTPFWPSLEMLVKNLKVENFFDGTFGAFHLWYLSATFFGGLLLLLCLHFKMRAKIILMLSLFFYLGNTIDLFGLSVINAYGGFPKGFFYLSLGYYVGVSNVNIKNSKWLFVFSMLAYATIRIIYPAMMTEFLLAFATMCLLIACLKSPGKPNIFSKLGGQYTLGIYILHVLVLWSIYRIYKYIGYVDYHLNTWSYIIVSVLCIVLPILFFKPLKKIFVQPLTSFIQAVTK